MADLRLADLHLNGAVLVEHHAAGGMLQRDGPNGGVVPERGNANALADVAGLMLVFGVLAVVVDVGHGLVEALVEAVVVVFVLGEAVHIAHGHDVLAAELQGIDAEHLADVLNVAFVRPRCLRHTVAAHRAGDGAVGEDSVGVALEVLAGVELRERAHRLGDDGVTVRGVSALVGEALDLAGDEGAVRPQPRDHVEADGMAHAVGHEGVLAGDVDLDETTAELHGKPRGERLIQRVLLIAEAAADVGLDDADPAPVDAEGLTDGAADDVRDLRGGNDDDLAGLLIGVGNVVFDVAVLHGRGVVPLVDADQPFLLDRLGVVAHAAGGVLQNVVGIFLVELRCAVLHGLLHVEDEGKRLIFDLDQRGSLRCGDLVLRDNSHNVIAVVADVAVEQTAVCNVLMRLLDRPRVARRGEFNIGDVKAGEDLDDAGDFLGFRDVNGLDIAVRNGRADHAGDEGAAVAQVVRVFGSAGSLVERVDAGYALTDIHIM